MYLKERTGHRIQIFDPALFPIPLIFDAQVGSMKIELASAEELENDFESTTPENLSEEHPRVMDSFREATSEYLQILKNKSAPIGDLTVDQIRNVIETAQGEKYAFPQP